MPQEPFADDAELAAIFARLRAEVRAEREGTSGATRAEAERLWPVGLSTRRRAPWKAALGRPVRAYLEPALSEQRDFNAVVLRLLDELAAKLERVEERLARLEQGA